MVEHLQSLFPLPPPVVGLDLRLPWKAPVLSGADKLPPFVLSPVPAPFTHHSLALLQQLRRHHELMTSSDRLRAAPRDVILPKPSPPTLALTSPLPAHPAPASVGFPGLLPLHAAASGGGVGDERLRGGGGGGGGGGGTTPGGLPGGGISSLMAAPSPDHPPPPVPLGTSPYGRKLFPCPQCRYTTDRRNNLKRHMLTMHQLSAKLLECCGLLFRTKAALREHALVFHYHGYTCFYCARRFCRKALLKRHLSVHNGQKEFLCNVCDYATSHKSNLERHRRVHMRGGQEGDEEEEEEGDDVTEGRRRHHHHDDGEPLSDDVKSNVSETNSNVDVSCDELSVCSEDEDEDEEINVHSD